MFLGAILTITCTVTCFAISPSYLPTREWIDANNAHTRLLKEGANLPDDLLKQLTGQWNAIKELHDGYVNGTNPLSKEVEASLQKNEALEAQVRAAQSLTPAQVASLKAEVAEFNLYLEQDLNPRAEKKTVEVNGKYSTFAKDVAAVFDQKPGFTGKKFVRLTAKSWIDGSKIALLQNLTGIMLRIGPNDEPSVPGVTAANDFKLFQTFSVEVEFTNGIIVSAKFVANSLDYRSGKTPWESVGLAGLIYVKESNISDWKGKKTVTFKRTVAGRPDLCFEEPLQATIKNPFQDIFNTISVDISGEDVKAHVGGSDFPSHKFWMGDAPLPSKLQVQPADYFK